MLQGQPEAGVLCEHARELCSDGDGRATFTGLYAIYEDNQARWHTEWDIATPGESGAGAEIEDDALGMEAIEVHELLGALRYERYAADHPYIQYGLKDVVQFPGSTILDGQAIATDAMALHRS